MKEKGQDQRNVQKLMLQGQICKKKQYFDQSEAAGKGKFLFRASLPSIDDKLNAARFLLLHSQICCVSQLPAVGGLLHT